ncbi:MAG: RNA methyltransferase [Saprospiraceae bacterium]|jgi:TrmH family RNA methyltransferase|uniref:TrmH family RNA methyltransferase n=1 Tax=Candidatus Brachybacter algidus TaxID=2982024 RepID=UPI001B4CBA10|nr:RNA methyltransferase [Candidatus Brachybacter algidus]MBP7304907.1 RNA methyltransferase [Saprospiraceae bacterium]MBK8354503.1 RNA methyltransferase [Candidatus Brachybacter algidus]MBK8750026.1 RNA methyltransferase [Candidatus Brachybacter algidus]MBK8843008.1 RNA methyltransferase [Candidatus Brachybacter algidus]MBK9024647.1 RNA methyltransferase [Candidatus Brachybacter algidus]
MINEKISKNYLKVLTSLNSKKFRQKYQLFIVEGEKIVSELMLNNPQLIKYLIINEDYTGNPIILNKFNIYWADNVQFSKISSMSTPPPILAICDMDEYHKINVEDIFAFHLYLDNVRDPGNIGTIIRTAEWFGIQKIYLSDGSVDLFHPRLIQSSMGSFFRVSCSILPNEDIQKLKRPLIGAVMDGMSLNKWHQPKEGTLIVGNESNGLSQEIIAALDQKIKIDHASTNNAESLNVGIATAVLLYAISLKM